jgi:hypothetical protein
VTWLTGNISVSVIAGICKPSVARFPFICLSSKGVTYTVHGILAFIKRLTSMSFQSLHHRFINWTKPATTSLMVGTLTDLVRSKSELMAENALLRQQLIMLRRHVKRPSFTTTDRLLLARAVRTWKHALLIVQEDDAPAVASPGMRACFGNTSPEQDLLN